MYVLAVAAIIFYMSKVPERYFPGTWNFNISYSFIFISQLESSVRYPDMEAGFHFTYVKFDTVQILSFFGGGTKPRATPALIKWTRTAVREDQPQTS